MIDEFGDLLVYFIKGGFCKKITRLNLSGIASLVEKEIAKVLKELADPKFCPNLLAIHLNDLDVNYKEDLQDIVAENFHIKSTHELENDHRGGLYLGLTTYLAKVRGYQYRGECAE